MARDIDTWRDVVEELDTLLKDEDARSHGRLVRSWLIIQTIRIEEAEDRQDGAN